MARDVHHRHAAPHRNGISHYDLKLAGFAVGYLRRQGAGVHVTIALHGVPEHERYEVADNVKSRVATYQHRAKMPRALWLEIRETLTEQGYSLHFHLLCVFPNVEWARKFTVSINNSKAYQRFGEKAVLAVPIVTAAHWDKFPGYFTQETTMQAWWAAKKAFPKPEGSFPFDGDRVIASRALKDTMVRSGRFETWRGTNVSRKPKPAPIAVSAAANAVSIATSVSRSKAAGHALVLVVNNALREGERQLSLFGEDRPVARLADFAHGVLPPAVSCEVEFRRKQLGLTQRELAAAIGISRPQLVNALKGRFGLAEWVVSRLRDFLLHGQRLAA